MINLLTGFTLALPLVPNSFSIISYRAWVSSHHSWGLLESVSQLDFCENQCLSHSWSQEKSWEEESDQGLKMEVIQRRQIPAETSPPHPMGSPLCHQRMCDMIGIWPRFNCRWKIALAQSKECTIKCDICSWHLTLFSCYFMCQI